VYVTDGKNPIKSNFAHFNQPLNNRKNTDEIINEPENPVVGKENKK